MFLTCLLRLDASKKNKEKLPLFLDQVNGCQEGGAQNAFVRTQPLPSGTRTTMYEAGPVLEMTPVTHCDQGFRWTAGTCLHKMYSAIWTQDSFIHSCFGLKLIFDELPDLSRVGCGRHTPACRIIIATPRQNPFV